MKSTTTKTETTTKVPQKVLLAIRPIDLEVVSEVLGDEFELLICYTLEQAVSHLNDNIGVIICGVRFDSGSMFELLSAAKANLNTKWVPYYLIAGEDIKYSHAILEGVRKAAKVREATGFIQLAKVVHDLGKNRAYEHIRQSIRDILSSTNGTSVMAYHLHSTESKNMYH
jgi:hypothetical protein